MEFRHASWFTDEVYDLLRARDVALVAVDADEAEGGASPLVPTASWGYLRLRRSAYDHTALESWSTTIRQSPWSEAYVFLKHEEGSPTGPAAAGEMGEILMKTS